MKTLKDEESCIKNNGFFGFFLSKQELKSK